MKVMIVSDTHTMHKHNLLITLKQHNVDYYIHCGDIYMTYNGIPIPHFFLVRGNNDFHDTPLEITTTIDNHVFFITHGHRYYVDDDDFDPILQRAKEVEANIVCFGHTHRPFLKKIDSILLINPGSLSYPRGSYRNPTYCILDTTSMETTFYDATTDTPCDPFTSSIRRAFSFRQFLKK